MAPKWSSHKPTAARPTAKRTFGSNQADLNGNPEEEEEEEVEDEDEDADSCLNQKATPKQPAGRMAATGRKAPRWRMAVCCLGTAHWRNNNGGTAGQ